MLLDLFLPIPIKMTSQVMLCKFILHIVQWNKLYYQLTSIFIILHLTLFKKKMVIIKKINICVGDVIGIASVKVESFAGVRVILKLHGNNGQDYIFTYCLFENVSSRSS
ncbi:unnamed protein product [Rhizophagus irregularis]|nr:unnamed protein product [Rhizophagus irregularis]